MLRLHRCLALLGLAAFASVVTLYFSLGFATSWRAWRERTKAKPKPQGPAQLPPELSFMLSGLDSHAAPDPDALARPDSMTLVVPRLKSQNASWIDDLHLPNLTMAIYVADDRSAPLHPPKNKGNEAMTYFTYIIDHYDALPDVVLFLHNHRVAWHNNDLLDNDAVETLRRLNFHRLRRAGGFFNLRCHWDPGCPDWLHTGATAETPDRKEERYIARAFSELFPLLPLPHTLAQPCCSQMAVTREAIRRTPRSRWIYFRDWLLRTRIRDSMSGRLWEYLWQVVFTEQSSVCPAMHACYCDAYGVCFADEGAFHAWFETRWRMMDAGTQLAEWFRGNGSAWLEDARAAGPLSWERMALPEFSRAKWLQEEVLRLRAELDEGRRKALERGLDPRVRAEIAGREYSPGDGY